MRWGDSLRTQGQAPTGRITIEDVYQAFKKRLVEEINERAAKDGYDFLTGGKAKCEHILCGDGSHDLWDLFYREQYKKDRQLGVRYENIGDKYCRDCGERL